MLRKIFAKKTWVEIMDENGFSLDGKFCKRCGTPTFAKKTIKYYDSKTGKPKYEITRRCQRPVTGPRGNRIADKCTSVDSDGFHF